MVLCCPWGGKFYGASYGGRALSSLGYTDAFGVRIGSGLSVVFDVVATAPLVVDLVRLHIETR